MAYRPPNFSGCAVATLVFIFLGVPLLAMMMLGERSCDMHIGPPCAISWGWMKLINAAVVLTICAVIGVLVAFLGRLGKDRSDKSDSGN
jgi:hypothetical protein